MAQQGVGLYLVSDATEALTVKSLIPGGDAAASGLVKEGDVLYSINGNVIHRAPLKVVKDLILGPAGSEVTLGLLRAKALVEVTLRRGLGYGPPAATRDKAMDGSRSSMNSLPPPQQQRDYAPPQREYVPPPVANSRGNAPFPDRKASSVSSSMRTKTNPDSVPCGIGILLIPDANGQLTVVGMNPGGPAKRSGEIKIGDLLHSVDDDIVLGMRVDEVRPLILGPPGSEVTVSLQRPGQQQLVNVRLTRLRMRSANDAPADASMRSSQTREPPIDPRRSLDSSSVARMDTRLSQRDGPMDTRLSQRDGPMDTRLSQRDGPMDTRLSQRDGPMDTRLSHMSDRDRGFDRPLGSLDTRMSQDRRDPNMSMSMRSTGGGGGGRSSMDGSQRRGDFNDGPAPNRRNPMHTQPTPQPVNGRHSMDAYGMRDVRGAAGGEPYNSRSSLGASNRHAPDAVGGIGVFLVPEPGGSFIVKGVTPGGAASRCPELSVGDIVRQIDGRSITGAPMDKVRELVKGAPGSTIMLGVHRPSLGHADSKRIMQVSLQRELIGGAPPQQQPPPQHAMRSSLGASGDPHMDISRRGDVPAGRSMRVSLDGPPVDDMMQDIPSQDRRAGHTHIGSRNPPVTQQASGDDLRKVGVGIVLLPDPQSGALLVKGFVPGGSAERSGRINKGDALYEIDGKKVFGMGIPHVRPLLLGPRGSVATLVFQRRRDGGGRQLVTVPLHRERVEEAPNTNHGSSGSGGHRVGFEDGHGRSSIGGGGGMRRSQQRSDGYQHQQPHRSLDNHAMNRGGGGGSGGKYDSMPSHGHRTGRNTVEQLL